MGAEQGVWSVHANTTCEDPETRSEFKRRQTRMLVDSRTRWSSSFYGMTVKQNDPAHLEMRGVILQKRELSELGEPVRFKASLVVKSRVNNFGRRATDLGGDTNDDVIIVCEKKRYWERNKQNVDCLCIEPIYCMGGSSSGR